MDTSQRYIEMCRKAEEIQSSPLRKTNGSVVYHPQHGVRLLYWSDHHGSPPEYYLHSPTIFLPRQDQLQEMVRDKYISDPALLSFFNLFVERFAETFLSPIHEKSMEELWLTFVMYERCKKIWNGQEWVKEEEKQK